MRLHNCFWIVALALAVSGCSKTDVIMKKQMETDTRLEQLIQGNAAVNARLTELTNEVKALRSQVKTNSADLEELKPALRDVKYKLESAQQQNREEKTAAGVPHIEVVNKDSSSGDRENAEQAAYMKAFGLFSANNYQDAVTAFTAFIKSYPQSEYAGNAQYWIGECHYTQHDFPQAIIAFNRVISGYPDGNKVPDAMLKVGYSYISMNEPAKAKVALQSLIDKYPKSQAAIKARERMNRN